MSKQLIVIKIGTSSLTSSGGSLSPDKIKEITGQIARLKTEGHHIVIVTSGSIAAGFGKLGYQTRPTTIAGKQAAAAVGQGLLMEEYTRYFAQHGLVTAQLLLTRGDFADQRRYKNAFNALETLLKRGAIPIINENDTIAIDEIKLGDNDTLSAQVAAMIHANLLILLTDVDGLYTKNPAVCEDARFIPVVEEITKEIEALAGDAGTANATGGMRTKISSARLATRAGVPVLICSSKSPDILVDAVSGNGKGTLFKARKSLKTRLQWTAFYARPKGNLYINRGAAEALLKQDKSLLPAGVVALEGDFSAGDVVNILMSESHEQLGRGTVRYNRQELETVIESGKRGTDVVIHRDDMVVSDYE